jgi:hypothetical protein
LTKVTAFEGVEDSVLYQGPTLVGPQRASHMGTLAPEGF